MGGIGEGEGFGPGDVGAAGAFGPVRARTKERAKRAKRATKQASKRFNEVDVIVSDDLTAEVEM